jgi:hypothetical protein
MKIRHVLATLGLAASFGCGGADEGLLESYAVENEILTTYNGDLALLGSYNELSDKSADTACVRYEDGKKHARVSEPNRILELSEVRNKEELAQKVGVDLGAKGRYGIAKVGGAVGMVNEFSNATDTATYLLEAEADYVVRDAAAEGRAIVLTQSAVSALAEGPAAFARRCGTHYAGAVRYGARFYLLIKFKSTSHMTNTQMSASLGVSGAGAGGDLRTRLEKTAKMAGVQVTISAASNGFWLNGKQSSEVVKQLTTGKLEQVLPAATELYFAMSQAVEHEYCLDAGEGTCGGKPSPGYFNRQSRAVSVTGVQLGAYHSLSNAKWNGNKSPFTTIKDRTATVRRFLEAYTELDLEMDAIYRDEVEPFLAATDAQKAYYNVAPPGEPRRSPTEVYQVAAEIEDLVHPGTGGTTGSLRGTVLDRIGKCLDTISIDLMASCTAGDTKVGNVSGELEAEQTVQWNQLRTQLDEIVSRKRIVPLNVEAVSWGIAQGGAQYQCDLVAEKVESQLAKLGTSADVHYRLPTRGEVMYLAPALGYGNVSFTSASIAHATWYTASAGQSSCTGDQQPFFKSEPGGATGFFCAEDDWWDDDLIPFCVPSSGPIPVMP